MNFKFFRFSIFMTIAMVIMSACEKESVDVETMPKDLSPFVMTFEDFITPEDVQIISSAAIQALNSENGHSMSIKDMYTETFSKTKGSHVTLYNIENFGNIFFNYIFDYFYQCEGL